MCVLCFPCRLGKLTQISRYQKTGKESGRKGGRHTNGRVCSVWFLLSWGLPAFMDAKPLPSSPSCLCFSPTYPVLFLFPGSSDGKESACNVEDLYSFPGSGRSPGEGNGNPLQYSCLENPMDRGAWRATAHGLTKSQIWLSDQHTNSLFQDPFSSELFSMFSFRNIAEESVAEMVKEWLSIFLYKKNKSN